MAAVTDVSVGYAAESAYGTPVTVTRWLEFTDESLDWKPNKVQGKGLRVGSKVGRSNRRVITTYDGGGAVTHEVMSKGFGVPFRAAFGAGVSTLISGTAYQQNFTLDDAPSSLTIQKGVVDSTGTVQPYTFAGCMCKSLELSVDKAGILMAKFDWDAKNMATATAYTAPSYAAGGSLFHFAQGAITIGGTVTAPTANTLATGGTAVANVTNFSLSLDNAMGASRFNLGGAGLKAGAAPRGVRGLSGKLTAEVTDTVLRDAILADTELAVVLTFTSTESLSTGVAQLSVYLPAVKFDGSMPQATGDLPTIDLTFDVLDNLTASTPAMISLRTADNSL